MSPSPMPGRLASAIHAPGTGASLFFDRGFDRYNAKWELPDGSKAEFLKHFAENYSGRKGQYSNVVSRRAATLQALGATTFVFHAHSRIAIGLGLPSPIENGFLFDRRTGAPYLPGSSVKGLARATAELIGASEIPAPPEHATYWSAATVARVFGGSGEEDSERRKGEVTFFDAFPEFWPKIEVDILTTHHQEYYRGAVEFAADWDEPIPVPFLTVAAGTRFVFHVGCASPEDSRQLGFVLGLGLDWLGIGAKKSVGYGVFGGAAPAPAVSAPRPITVAPGPRPAPRHPEQIRTQPEPIPKAHGETLWKNVEVGYEKGELVAAHGSKRALGTLDQAPSEMRGPLKKKSRIRLNVVVRQVSEHELVIVRVSSRD